MSVFSGVLYSIGVVAIIVAVAVAAPAVVVVGDGVAVTIKCFFVGADSVGDVSSVNRNGVVTAFKVAAAI